MTLWTAVCQASLFFTISQSLLKLMSIESVMPSNHLILSPSPPALSFSQHWGLFQWVSSLHQMAKILELQLQHQSFQGWFPLGLSGLISLLSKGLSRVFSNTMVQRHQFFSTQPVYCPALTSPYMTIGKAVSLVIWMFVGKVMSLLFNMLSRFCHCFSSKEQASFNFLAAFTIHSDFWT